jgi:hypothetical protein
MTTKNSLVAFLFLASPVWSQQQVAATGLQTPDKLIVTPTVGRVSSPAAAADNEVPFRGRFEGGVAATPIDPPFLSELTKGMGDATQLGRFAFVRPETVNLLTSTSIGSFAFTAANGDILTADFTGQGSLTATPGVLSVMETAFISGGTGRFAGATGHFTVTSSFDFATMLTVGSFEGTISSPGAKHASPSATVFQN